MELFEKLKNKKRFSSLDLAIVNYILAYPRDVPNLTIDELAKATYTSTSSIVRLCKKLDMKGYADFRIKLATEVNTFLINEERIEVDMPIRPDASIDEIAKTFLNLQNQTIVDIYNILDYKKLQEAANLLFEADYIEYRGSGPSLIVEEDFIWKLSKIGLPVATTPLVGFDTFMRIKKAKKPVALIVSNYGNSSLVHDWMEIMHDNGYKIIMICSNNNSDIFSKADVQLLINSNENYRGVKLGSFASRIAATYVLDIIYALIFMKDYNNNVKLLYEQGEKLKTKCRCSYSKML